MKKDLVWVKTEDRLPQEDMGVLVYGECCECCYNVVVAEIEDGEWFMSRTGDDLNFKPMYWAEIPLPK